MRNGDEVSAAVALNDEIASLPSGDQLPALTPNIRRGLHRPAPPFTHRHPHAHAAPSRSLQTRRSMPVHGTCDASVQWNLTSGETSERDFCWTKQINPLLGR